VRPGGDITEFKRPHVSPDQLDLQAAMASAYIKAATLPRGRRAHARKREHRRTRTQRKKGTIWPHPRAAQVCRLLQNFAAANNTIFIHIVRRFCIRILQRRTPHFHPPNLETIVATQRRLWQLLWGQEESASLTVSNKFWHLDTSSSKYFFYDLYASAID
jgi:hypothetical protein